jgi:hypothetical protein
MVIHWEFTRGRERIICEVDRNPDGAFAVVLVACRSLRRASAGTFGAIADALRRHADVANKLRSSGWKLAAYTR